MASVASASDDTLQLSGLQHLVCCSLHGALIRLEQPAPT
jgi:hypothetical protein